MSSYFSIESTKTARLFLLIHLFTLFLSSVMAFVFLQPEQAWGFLLGELLLAVSILSLYLAIYWGMILKKMALAVGVIVFKWPLLIYIVLQSVNDRDLPFIYVACGLSTWLISALVWAGCEKMELVKSGRTL